MKLIGKMVYFYDQEFRCGRVIRVKSRANGDIITLTVRIAGASARGNPGYYGPKRRITRDNFRFTGLGVLFRRRVIPLAEVSCDRY